MKRVFQIYPFGQVSSKASREFFRVVCCLLAVMAAAVPASSQVQFPGPAAVAMPGEALSAVSMPLEVGEPDFLVSGMAHGTLTLHRYSSGSERLLQISQFSIGGQVTELIPWEGRPLLSQGVVAATVNPDRLVFLQVSPEPPYFTHEGAVDLEEDPGTMSFLGEVVGGIPEMAVSLPGIDQVLFLRQEAETWNITEVLDTGDRPHAIIGLDLDGDLVRELVTANSGPLSENLGIYRKSPSGEYEATWQDFVAGNPTALESFDLDGDGVPELAVTVQDSPEIVLLQGVAGQLVDFGSIGLTLPANSLHFSALFDGTIGLFTSNRDRGLTDFFQLQQGLWTRLNSYYPGCHPLGMTTGDFNGDGGRDLASLGGEAEVVTVMFANSQPGFWGYPALTLNASPGASELADFNGDGRLDLVVANGDRPLLSFFAGLATGGFEMIPTDLTLPFYPGPVAALDTDEDPLEELVILDSSGDLFHVADFIAGQGFVLVSQIPAGDAPFFVASRDLDTDGWDDLVILTREVEEVGVFFGSGDHDFSDQTALGLTSGADWVEILDLDADGLADLAMTDGVNRVWTTLNQGDRSFGPLDWLNAGSGARLMAVGDLDQDLDDDLIVLNHSDESLSMFENIGTGSLVRRIGAHTLPSEPSGLVIRDMNGDGRTELVMNLREERLLGLSYPLVNWEYSQVVKYAGGPDVTDFNVEDLNSDDVPDILTLDRSLKLGLTLLNVEQELVPVHPEALSVTCDRRFLELRIRPDRPGSWQVDLWGEGSWHPLVVGGQALLGDLDYEQGTWILRAERSGLPGLAVQGLLRLTVGEGAQRESLDISLAGLCAEAPGEDLPLVTWAGEPWPNPFNPLVNARFALARGAEVRAGIYDLAGRQITTLADGWYAAGNHTLQWDGKQAGHTVAAGVYLLRVSTPESILHHKIMLLK